MWSVRWQYALRILARIDRRASGNPGNHRLLRGGVVKLKIELGPGYRVCCTRCGDNLIIWLAGGDKHTQRADIDAALELAKVLC